MVLTGLIHNPLVCSKLIASLASTTLLTTAHFIANQHTALDTYTWNTIMRGYCEQHNPKQALHVYAHIGRLGLHIDSYTLVFAVKACGLLESVMDGKLVHAHVIKHGFAAEAVIATSLVGMYGVFGKLGCARRAFDESPERDLVLWNAMVAVCAQREAPGMAFEVLRSMIGENVRPNGVTMASVLSACSCLRSLRKGKQFHCYAVRNLDLLDVVVFNALIDMYSKCGCLINARKVFHGMRKRNVISWTSMINGYSKNNRSNEALLLLKEMESANIRPDEVTILGVISMCSKLGSLEMGEWIDQYIEMNGHRKKRNVHVENALVDMHAKCGNIKKACQIFYEIEKKTLVSWSTIIQGLAMHGHGLPALTLFYQMQREGFEPDDILFLGVLSACNHAGLVQEGRKCFQSMEEDYHLRPGMEHYGCLIDLLCRAGLINEALEVLGNMPMKPDAIMWRTLMKACQNHGNASLARHIMNHLLELEPEYSGNHVIASNLQANMGEWRSVENTRTEMVVLGVTKGDPGSSFVPTSCNV
ncbi:hypothetical protein Syun_023724 [Stephania yunnanensis]|uniref:Pentatricopeptide repeat-containing protein n=1 Tax=Stephania yunnanensis TaxID=152371 RepID=A0AAP0HZV8_9MAGN